MSQHFIRGIFTIILLPAIVASGSDKPAGYNFGDPLPFFADRPYNPVDSILNAAENTKRPHTAYFIGIGVAVTVASLFVDQTIYRNYQDGTHNPYGVFSNPIKSIAETPARFGIQAALFGIALSSGMESLAYASLASMEGIVTWIPVAFVLKTSLYVEHENDGYHWWFPSGQSFVEAGAYGRIFGVWGALPWIVVSTLASTDRGFSGSHYLSDYVASAAITSFLGYTYAIRYAEALENKGVFLSFVPYFGRGIGLSFKGRF